MTESKASIGTCEKCGEERFLVRMASGQLNYEADEFTSIYSDFTRAECGCVETEVTREDREKYKTLGRDPSE